MARAVVRFEPPLALGLREALQDFDCVTRYIDGEPDPGEAIVRDFIRGGGFEAAAAANTSTTYFAVEDEAAPDSVAGYVTLALTQIRLTGGEKKADEGLSAVQNADFGAVRIAMIGVDRRFVGKGYGKLLMDTVILHAVSINRDVSARFVVADAVKTQLDWYRRQGFVENRSAAEAERLQRAEERFGVASVSMRRDLGPHPQKTILGD